MRLVDRRVRVGGETRVGIRDGDAPETLSSQEIWRVLGVEVLVPQGIVFRCVAVRPAVYGDPLDIAGRIEAARAKCARELIAYMPFEIIK